MTPAAMPQPEPRTLNALRSPAKPMIMKLWYITQIPRNTGSSTAVTEGIEQSSMPTMMSRMPPTMLYPLIMK